MKISIIHSKTASAQKQMETDEKIFKELDPSGLPVLRHYDWERDSITYGVFAKPNELFNYKGIEKYNIDLARRITGGGATLHFLDLAFSFFLPKKHPNFSENTLENYAWVNSLVAKALSKWLPEEDLLYAQKEDTSKPADPLFFCMAKLTQYDVLYKGKKIAGAAQRRKANGLLHHGSIAIAQPNPDVLADILKNRKVINNILTFHHGFIDNHTNQSELGRWRAQIREQLNRVFENEFN